LSAAGDVAVDVLPEWESQTFYEVKTLFVAQSPQQESDTGKDYAHVHVLPVIPTGVKYLIADIRIEMKTSFVDFLLIRIPSGLSSMSYPTSRMLSRKRVGTTEPEY
jgi:hypothetical protein